MSNEESNKSLDYFIFYNKNRIQQFVLDNYDIICFIVVGLVIFFISIFFVNIHRVNKEKNINSTLISIIYNESASDIQKIESLEEMYGKKSVNTHSKMLIGMNLGKIYSNNKEYEKSKKIYNELLEINKDKFINNLLVNIIENLPDIQFSELASDQNLVISGKTTTDTLTKNNEDQRKVSSDELEI